MSFIVTGAKETKPHSVVIICPVDAIEKAKSLADFGLSGPLSPKGYAPATHYAFHTWADEQLVETLASSGLAPSVANGIAPKAHLAEVIKSNGLRLVSRSAGEASSKGEMK